MVSLQEAIIAKVAEAEQLVVDIKALAQDSEESNYAILRWAVVSDETQKLMIQAEERLSPAQLARLQAEINVGREAGQIDRWRTYREGEWRLPKFGAPGPGDEPPPLVNLRDFFL
ncbi:MAG: hypothetical protein H0V70_08800 [Ktedonobacteraceae bacterium]|nr:hypothetical protein [Ktedonobacteraceae bacterium]